MDTKKLGFVGLVAAASIWSSSVTAVPVALSLVEGSASDASGHRVAGADGATWELPGGPRVHAEPDTELKILTKPQPLTLGRGKTTPGYTVLLKRGSLRFDVPRDAESAIVLSAPHGVTAIVQSGAVRARTDSAQTAVVNDRGMTTVGAGGFRQLAPGKVLVQRTGKAELRDLASAPVAARAGRLILVAGGKPAKGTEVAWDPVANAVGYRVEVQRTGGELTRSERTAPTLELGGYSPGAYQVNVRTLDPSGLESSAALQVPLRVVGLELPPGSELDASGAVRIGTTQKLRLLAAEGLEVAFGNSSLFAPAPAHLGVYKNAPTRARFRIPGSEARAELRLVPVALRAQIEFSPRAPIWPKDPVGITVKVVDGQGRPAAAPVKARVLLGVEDLRVPFAKRGQHLAARVPPRSGKGPWVLRVEVQDPHGGWLGREFVEVASVRPE